MIGIPRIVMAVSLIVVPSSLTAQADPAPLDASLSERIGGNRSFYPPFFAIGYPRLFDVDRDLGETTNLVARSPDVVADMTRRFAAARNGFEPIDKTQVPDFTPSAS